MLCCGNLQPLLICLGFGQLALNDPQTASADADAGFLGDGTVGKAFLTQFQHSLFGIFAVVVSALCVDIVRLELPSLEASPPVARRVFGYRKLFCHIFVSVTLFKELFWVYAYIKCGDFGKNPKEC